jgi:hypothetical protein
VIIMTNSDFMQTIFDGGIHTIHFFNGRMLSGEDLRTEQDANLAMHRRLGSAIGGGVVHGMEVSASQNPDVQTAPMVRITPGMAVNPKGQILHLATAVDFSLSVSATTAQPAEPWFGFEACRPPQSGVYVAGSGVYLLAIGPAQKKQGRAPVSGLGNVEAQCNTKYMVEGIQLRLLQIDLTPAQLSDEGRLRNLVAGLCFGTLDNGPRLRLVDPFDNRSGNYGLVDDLRTQRRLTECEVPLAIFHWKSDSDIRFVDMWSVRRRLTIRDPNDPWHVIVGNRRYRESESMLLQFQHQIADMLVQEAPVEPLAEVKSSDVFHRLPPAGLLPVRKDSGGSTGFIPDTFFENRIITAPAMLSADQIRSFLQDSFYYEPIDLAGSDPIYVYFVKENQTAVSSAQAARRFVLFANVLLGRARPQPIHIEEKNTVLDAQAFSALMKAARQVYSRLHRIVATSLNPPGNPLTSADVVGLRAIDHVISASTTSALLSQMQLLTNLNTLAVMGNLADMQVAFTQTWLSVTLPQQAGQKYPDTLAAMIRAVSDLLEQSEVLGVRGLLPALADGDLMAAVTAQRAINARLAIQLGGIVTGQLKINLDRVIPQEVIQPGGTYVFVFLVQALTTADETYSLHEDIQAPEAHQEQWAQGLELVDDLGNELPDHMIDIPQGASVEIRAAVNVPEGTEDETAYLSLTVTSQTNPAGLDGSGIAVIEVGEEASSQQVTFGLDSAGRYVTIEGEEGEVKTVVVHRSDRDVAVRFMCWVDQDGTYDFSASVSNDPDHLWSADIDRPAGQPPQFFVEGSRLITVRLSGASSAPGAVLVIQGQKADDPEVDGSQPQPIRMA